MPTKTKIVFLETEKWEQDYIKEKFGHRKELSFDFFKKSLGKVSQKEMAVIKTADILAVFIYSAIDKNILERFSRLKFIATMSTGFDHIDLNACQERGVKVSNVPFYGNNTVAEHVFALILAFARKLPQSLAKTRLGDFTLNDLRGFDLKGKTIGIIGLGYIGQWVARIAFGFGMKILAFDPKKQPAMVAKFDVKCAPLDYLLVNSDIITLHAPYNEQTHHLINKNNIAKIKKGALLINTARGGLVETEALLLALQKGILAGAGLDVLEEECFIKEEKELLTKPFQKTCDLRIVLRNHLLINNPKVLITPHNGFNSQEALIRILDSTIENIQAFLKKKPINLVD